MHNIIIWYCNTYVRPLSTAQWEVTNTQHTNVNEWIPRYTQRTMWAARRLYSLWMLLRSRNLVVINATYGATLLARASSLVPTRFFCFRSIWNIYLRNPIVRKKFPFLHVFHYMFSTLSLSLSLCVSVSVSSLIVTGFLLLFYCQCILLVLIPS
jgi:hypothetical protein